MLQPNPMSILYFKTLELDVILPVVFNDQDTEFDKNNLTNLKSITINRDPITNNEVAKKKLDDDTVQMKHLLYLFKHYKTI